MKTQVFTFYIYTSHGKRNQAKLIDNYTMDFFSTTEKDAIKQAIKSIRNMFEGETFSYIRPQLLKVQSMDEYITNKNN